jgi:hypothetical protein
MTEGRDHHWSELVQTSLIWRQNDVATLHLPPEQPPEQHSLFAEHVAPDALQEACAAHWLPVQRPLQH